MGNVNDLIFIEGHRDRFRGPYLEVGAKDYGNTQDLRHLFSGAATYIGTDMEGGKGVDVVADVAEDISVLREAFGMEAFGTIFCLSVLEHCKDPFGVARNLTSLLEPGGVICISVPFALGLHAYPADYWRFTHEGIQQLFPDLSFDMELACAATTRRNDFTAVGKDLGRIPFSSTYHFRKGQTARGVSVRILRTLSRMGVLRWLSDYKYIMPPTHIYMVGELKKHDARGGTGRIA
ncbi:MAG: methyltransferase domain-containing protein [Phycisphaerae bacterium]|nr:methyltransferase domain-containing protein [Phycisphaerae bacterium]